MSQISRLRDAEISNGNLINADDIDAELNQLVSESNAQDTELTSIGTDTYTFSGVKTFSSNPKMNGVDERTAGAGFTADSVRMKDGMVKVAGTPAEGGEIGYASNVLTYHNGSAVVKVTPPVSAIYSISTGTQAGTGSGALYVCTSTFTLTLQAAATNGANWIAHVRNDGSGVITIDPDGSETIDGLTTITIGPGNSCTIVCDGSNYVTLGRKAELIVLRDQKTQNTDGGTFTSGAWRTRDLNTEVQDTGGNCTLSTNQFTLSPGTYQIEASAPGFRVQDHQIRLQNITDGSTTLIGTSAAAENAVNTITRSFIQGQFSITANKTFEIQHQCSATGTTTGFGNAANYTTEVYTTVVLRKVV
ncbi:MAG: hypothetical protein K0Q50_707 [Vampirovibrio sp.]|jgi:hypothetical protein|nr:hypothetical protein [Vampirovibrio sp.]